MISLKLIILLIAVVCFLLSAFGVSSTVVKNWQSLALAFLTVALTLV